MNINLMTGLLRGGAANAAKQLHAGLQKQGVNSRLYHPLKLSPIDDANVVPAKWEFGGVSGIVDRVKFRLHRQSFKAKVRDRPKSNEIFTSPIGSPRTIWPPKNHPVTDCDVIHLHWVAKFIDYTTFFESLPADLPVVWTLHDMNPFTGGCHFTAGCDKYANGCGSCPQLPSPAPQDISHDFFQIKRNALRNVNLHIVTASRWMAEQAKQSPVFENVKSYHRIPYGLPLDQCELVDRKQARQELGIDPDAFVFAFGAADIENKRKGVKELLTGLQQIADLPNALGLILGGGDLPDIATPTPTLRSLGFVTEMQRRVLIYCACDVFVLPSLQDNMPLTGLEVLASGTPIVGFDASGIPDTVRPNETGLLAKKDDAIDLGNKIRFFAENPAEAIRMGKIARQVAMSEYLDEREAKDYVNLYAALLAEKDV